MSCIHNIKTAEFCKFPRHNYNKIMPELPEVETIVNDLKTVLPGLKIRDVWTDFKKCVKRPKSFAKFKKEIIGKKILGIERRGKNILILLSRGLILLVHQKMTGHLLYGKWTPSLASGGGRGVRWESVLPGPLRDDPENRFIHLIFFLSNGYQLALCDMRKFAKVALWKATDPEEIKDVKELGPDPFGKNFTFEKFRRRIKGRRAIKQVLMDPKIVAGIGNIYADEILWKASVHPAKQAEKLDEKELKKIYGAITPILKRAIKARGSSYIDYRDAFGGKGSYQKTRLAYQMTGTKCKKKDGGIIEKIKIGQRSAHFCPVHQKP